MEYAAIAERLDRPVGTVKAQISRGRALVAAAIRGDGEYRGSDVSEVCAGRYWLEEVIGVGSFATVHRAVDDRLEDTVVVKILAENHSLNPEVRERFIAEGRALRRVSSPHVVTVHDIGESERQ